MQERSDSGKERFRNEGFWKRKCQERMGAVGKGGMQEMKDSGKEGCRKGGMQEKEEFS